MMNYLPFENITYRTKLTSDEIRDRIQESIEQKKTFRMTGVSGSSNHKPYEGSINGYSFNITRIFVFMLIWCGGVALVLIAFLSASLREETFEPAVLIPGGMLLFGYGLTVGGFKYESTKTKKYLAQLFDAEYE